MNLSFSFGKGRFNNFLVTLVCTGCKLNFWTKLIVRYRWRMLAHFDDQWIIWQMKYPSLVGFIIYLHVFTFWDWKTQRSKLPRKYCGPTLCFYDITVPSEEDAKLFFCIFLRKHVQYLRSPKGFKSRKINLEEWEFLSAVAASWNNRFLRQIKRCVLFQSSRSRRSAFLWQILTTCGRIILYPTNCSRGWTVNRPPIA